MLFYKRQCHTAAIFLDHRVVVDVGNVPDVNDEIVGLSSGRRFYPNSSAHVRPSRQ
jgi:hypothetical protein